MTVEIKYKLKENRGENTQYVYVLDTDTDNEDIMKKENKEKLRLILDLLEKIHQHIIEIKDNESSIYTQYINNKQYCKDILPKHDLPNKKGSNTVESIVLGILQNTRSKKFNSSHRRNKKDQWTLSIPQIEGLMGVFTILHTHFPDIYPEIEFKEI